MDIQITFTGNHSKENPHHPLLRQNFSNMSLSNFFQFFSFSLAVAPSSFGFRFASVGEDSSLRIWKDSNVSQVLSLPAQSVWSVSFLPNSDVVTGSR